MMRYSPEIMALTALLAALGCQNGEPAPKASSAATTQGNAGAPRGVDISTPAAAPVDLRRIGAAIPEQITARAPNTLLGGELGLDHVGLAVSDLDATARAYAALGFSRPQPGKLPNGIRNVNFYFGDGTYLELLTAYDRNKAADVAGFLARHGAGIMFFVLAVFSAEETTRFLRDRGVQLGAPIPGRIENPGVAVDERPMWHTLFVTEPRLPGAPFFFIAYDRAIRNITLKAIKDENVRRHAFAHQNKALGVKAVWLAVQDLDAAVRLYGRLGLSAERRVTHPYFGTRGVVMPVGQGFLVLLAAAEDVPAQDKLLAKSDGTLLGVTLQSESVTWSVGFLQSRLQVSLPTYKGIFGSSVLVRPERAGGTWLELADMRL